MDADSMMIVVLSRALSIVVLITRVTPVVLHMASAISMDLRCDLARVLPEHPRVQPEKQAAHHEPFDKGMVHSAHRVFRIGSHVCQQKTEKHQPTTGLPLQHRPSDPPRRLAEEPPGQVLELLGKVG